VVRAEGEGRVWRRYGGSMGFPGLTARLRGLDARVVDVLIAVGLAVLIELQFLLGDQPGREADAVNLIGGLFLTIPLIWRRSAPLAMFCIFLATGLANEALGGSLFSFPADGSHGEIPPVATLATGVVAVYSLSRYTGDRDARIGLFLGLAGLWGIVLVSGQVDFGSFFFSGALAVIPWLIGRNIRSRSLRLAAAEREQEQRTRLAVGDERARIARELHDVVAHSVGIIVIQAEGARRVFDRDPERAREALDTIEQTARTALSDMRRSLGVLREADGAPLREPQPGLGELDGLLEQAREGGLEVEVEVEGEPRTLPRGVDLSAYRIVQEALTNTIKHAGAVHSRITLRYSEGELEVEVADDGPGPSENGAGTSSGLGLLGMRERAASHGGEVEAGKGPEGGFVIRASLPFGE
jgi:signal transduction histidine kinase